MTSSDLDLRQRIAWARQGAELFFSHLDTIDDADFGRETTLTGWTLAHLVGHLGYNASALSRLVHWARTGEKTPMYSSTDARDAEIEHGATLPATELRSMARNTDATLRAEFDELPPQAWSAEVVTAQGRPVTATEIPWMRCREVWVHAVDLGTGADFADFPDELVEALLTDVTNMWVRRQQSPALRLVAADRDRIWEVVLPGEQVTEVTGTVADLTRWATGRGETGVRTVAGGAVPAVGRWL